MIFRQIIAWTLGPSGMKILLWMIDNRLWLTGVLVMIAILALMFPQQRKRVEARLQAFYYKTPLAPAPQDREAIARVKARYEERKQARKANKP